MKKIVKKAYKIKEKNILKLNKFHAKVIKKTKK